MIIQKSSFSVPVKCNFARDAVMQPNIVAQDMMTLIDRDKDGQTLASLNYKKIPKFEEELYRVLFSYFLLYLRCALSDARFRCAHR